MKYLFFSVSIFVSIINSNGANLVITPSPNSNAQCPLTILNYFVTTSSGGLPACTYTWSIVGGSFVNNINTGTPVQVTWNDATGTGTLTVTASACNPTSENGSTKTNTYTRLSVFGKSFTAPPNATCTNAINVPLCSTNAINICADKMFVQNTGAIGEPPLKEVDTYRFTIPAGWREFGTTNNGPITIASTVNMISLEPTSANGGVVTVVGSIKNTCTNTSISNSNAKTITITRTPVLSITAPPGFFGPQCGILDPLIFSVSTTNLPCATGFAWTKPATWTGTSTTNSITLTPDGNTGGSLSVAITLSTGGTTTVTLPLNFINTIGNPTISKNTSLNTICAGESWVYTNTPPSTHPLNFGFDWYATGGLLINGSSTSLTSPLHTTTNSVSVSATSGSYGTAYVHTRVNNNACTPSNYVWSQSQVGTLSSSQFTISGPSTACPSRTVSYLPTYIDPSITNYQWGWSGFVSASGQGTPYLSATTGSSFTSGTITLRLGNRCGLTGSPAIKTVYRPFCSGGFSFAVSPNPSSTTLRISMVDEVSGTDIAEQDLPEKADETTVTILNSRSKIVASGNLRKGNLDLDISALPNGLYIARIYSQGKAITKQIVINH